MWYIALGILIGLFEQKGPFWIFVVVMSPVASLLWIGIEFIKSKVMRRITRSRMTQGDWEALTEAEDGLFADLGMTSGTRFLASVHAFLLSSAYIAAVALLTRGGRHLLE